MVQISDKAKEGGYYEQTPSGYQKDSSKKQLSRQINPGKWQVGSEEASDSIQVKKLYVAQHWCNGSKVWNAEKIAMKRLLHQQKDTSIQKKDLIIFFGNAV